MKAMEAWPLMGRAEELSILVGMLDGSDEDAGVVIAGRAGVGKTRLAREAVAEASKLGWAVRWVVGTAASQSIPLGAFAQWAARLDGDPLQIVGGVIAAITASEQGSPILVAVDDAHLLDDLSAFVLYQLILRRSATVIATLRSGERTPDAVTALWKDAHLRRLDLQPLSRLQSEELLASVLGGQVDARCADRMWGLTCGNVLFLRQVVTQELDARRLIAGPGGWRWTGAMAVSESLIDLVDAQIGGVPDAVGDVIDLVALAEPLELDYLRRLTEPDAVEDAERRGLITVSRTTPTSVAGLGHPLYGEVRLARAGQVRLERLRGRLAGTMAAPSGAVGAPDPMRLALLWLQSDLAPDHNLFTRAARAAIRRLDWFLAQRLAEAAVAAGAGVRTELLCANALAMLSRGAEAEEALKSLTTRQLPEPAWSSAVILRGTNLLWMLGQPEQSRRVIDDALASASGSVSHRLLACRAVQLAVEPRPAEALRICESIDRGELAALPALIPGILAWAHTIALGDLGHPLLAAAVAEEAATVATAYPLALFHTHALILGGCLPQALTVANRTYQQCADLPGIGPTFAAGVSGMVALANGDLHTATERLRCAVTELADRADGISWGLGIEYAEALARAGDLDAAAQALAQMQRNRHPACTYLESDTLVAAAWVAAARGRTPQARALARQAAEFARTHGQHAREVVCLQGAIQFGDQHHAARLAELAELVEGPRAGLVARWAAALADNDGGEALLGVSHDLEAMGDRIAAADAAAHAAIAFRHRQQRGAALTASARASRLIGECGGITPATRTAATPLPLTNRERETAELVAAGLSNKQIAESLTLSVRTVEGHIFKCCTKLGFADRTELAQLMSQLAHRPAP